MNTNTPNLSAAHQAMLAYDRAQAELTAAKTAVALARQRERTARKALEQARQTWLVAIEEGAA